MGDGAGDRRRCSPQVAGNVDTAALNGPFSLAVLSNHNRALVTERHSRQLLSQLHLFEQHFPDDSVRSLRSTRIRRSRTHGLTPVFIGAVVLVCFVSEGFTRDAVWGRGGRRGQNSVLKTALYLVYFYLIGLKWENPFRF